MNETGGAEGDVSGKGDSPLSTAGGGARGITARLLAWLVGGLLGVVGAVTTISDLLHHHHGIGPYLLAAAFLLLFLAALDMGRAERSRARRVTRSVRRLSAVVDRQENAVQHLEHDRDEWRRMQAAEASVNRRLSEELERAQRLLQGAGGTAGEASIGPTLPLVARAGPAPTQRRAPRHQRRGPPGNQPRLFDQDDEG